MVRRLFLVIALLGTGWAQEPPNELTPELLSRLDAASQHAKANQLQEAIAAYTEVLVARPDLFSPYLYRGKLYQSQKEHAKAVDDFTAALKLKPHLPEAWLQRCMANYDVAEYAKAVPDCEKYIDSKPRAITYEPFYYKGMAHAGLRENDKAVEMLAKAFEINNNLPEAHRFMGQLYLDQENLLSALREFSIVIQQRPGDKEALKRRSVIKASLGDELGSRQDLDKAR
jgi:tetratricopeptide (TPR) repeat protein